MKPHLFTKTITIAVVLVALNGVTLAQSAEGNSPTTDERPPMEQPMWQQGLPVESGALSSHVGIGFYGSEIADEPIYSLGLEAQVAIADIFEIGLNVPLLERGLIMGVVGPLSSKFDDIRFGNVQANSKLKLFGDSRGSYAFSVYANGTLPTTSLDVGDRDFFALQTGAAFSWRAGIATFGINAGTWLLFWWCIR